MSISIFLFLFFFLVVLGIEFFIELYPQTFLIFFEAGYC